MVCTTWYVHVRIYVIAYANRSVTKHFENAHKSDMMQQENATKYMYHHVQISY